ncbi:CHASE2 domain-containing protein [Bradyrhizobium sp. 21]|uniref:CHASE2 domain-containing protein n=1 Tax=Bradyrhizobium sp. 21 TaxID=2782666 RepID=UPI001FF79E38|nr:CHASE2 domain-containing protein [Bradyrhizobium sp. 21]MCK1385680.1 CHASE2 domain-containing protein [Bradyrhizobium sp. 21]
MKGFVGFFTRGTRLNNISLWKLAALSAVTILVVFAAGIERRSSTLVEWVLDPDNLINFAIDWRGHAPNGVAVTVIDIDEASYEAWGQPLSTPRKRLFELIEAVERRRAASIVVDIDVLANSTLEEAALTLDRLASYSRRQSAKGAGRIPLSLVRSMWGATVAAQRRIRSLVCPSSIVSGSPNGMDASKSWWRAVVGTQITQACCGRPRCSRPISAA